MSQEKELEFWMLEFKRCLDLGEPTEEAEAEVERISREMWGVSP